MLSEAIKSLADPLVERLWNKAFSSLGKLQRAPQLWAPKGGEKVLVVAPHPDDEVLGCGGTIIRHLQAHDNVHIVIVTDGRLSRFGGLDEELIAQERAHEAKAACRLLGEVELQLLGFPEGEWEEANLVAELETILEKVQPDYIYVPSWLDYHPEHVKVARSISQVVSKSQSVRIYTLHIPLMSLVNVRISVADEMPRLRQIFDSYYTQTESIRRGLRIRRYAGSWSGLADAVEEFIELSGEVYQAIHLRVEHTVVVRGLRRRSFTDPLSYLSGRKSRRHMKRMIQQI